MNPAVEGSEPSGHPNGRKATVGLVAPVCKTGLYGAPLVQLQLRPHSHLLLVTDLLLSLRRTATRFDSGRKHHGAHLAGAGGGWQPRRWPGSIPGRVSTARRPRDEGNGVLNR